MCGRYWYEGEIDYWLKYFGVDEFHETRIQPTLDVRPTTMVPVVTQDTEGKRRLQRMKWGYLPAWARKGGKIGPQINARGETLAEKPFFKAALRRTRCVIPASGFYEWRTRDGKRKQPMAITVTDAPVIAFAGLYDADADPSCAIVTTTANTLVAAIHDRMPVILDSAAMAIWLDPRADLVELLACLQPRAWLPIPWNHWTAPPTAATRSSPNRRRASSDSRQRGVPSRPNNRARSAGSHSRLQERPCPAVPPACGSPGDRIRTPSRGSTG